MNAEHPEATATILIVDDQPENLAVLSRLLQGRYRVRAARSGEQALRAAVTEPRPDLILCDIMMPEMDGYTVLAHLRELAITRDIPLIFITALDAEENEQRGLELGAVDYLTKPIKPAIMLARVRSHLELKESRDKLANQNTLLEAKVAERTEALKKALTDIEATHASLKKTHFGTLMAISELAQLRGGLIGEHSRRVADLARKVAHQLKLDDAEIQDVFIAGLLHDVGKIGFPDKLLSKPVSTLSSEELAIYRRHPTSGALIIKKVSALSRVAEFVLSHHENYDGSGFPDGLSGLNIPLGARIIAAISDYDSLKYGGMLEQAMTAKQACQYLLTESGQRYDPMVIDKLESLLSAEEKFEIDEIPVHASHLQEGMVLTRDVLHPDGFLLLSKGTVMNHRLIDQLVVVEKHFNSSLQVFVLRERLKTAS
jgi:putative nucleotidyltransferase with HDIG domain